MTIQTNVKLVWENEIDTKIFLEGDGFTVRESISNDKEPYYTFDYQVHRRVASALHKAGYSSRAPYDKDTLLHVLRLLRNEMIDIGFEGEILLSNRAKGRLVKQGEKL